MLNPEKTVLSKKIPPYLLPLRALYRYISRNLFQRPRVVQAAISGVTYLLWANEDVGKRMLLQRGYEVADLLAFSKLVRRGDVCIDVGGNVGIYALNLARLCSGDGGVVYVIEPMRRNQLMVELAAELNSFCNIRVFGCALSSAEGRVDLVIPSIDGAYAYISETKPEREGKSVRALTLDQFCLENGLANVAILKIDVEGAEKLVLDGGSALFADAARRPRVVMAELVDEFLARFGSNIESVLAQMSRYGYSPLVATRSGDLRPFNLSDRNRIFNIFFLADQN